MAKRTTNSFELELPERAASVKGFSDSETDGVFCIYLSIGGLADTFILTNHTQLFKRRSAAANLRWLRDRGKEQATGNPLPGSANLFNACRIMKS
jgi:hypothetical protein